MGMTASPPRRGFAFRLRTLLIAVACAAGCRRHHFGGMQDYVFPSEAELFGTMILVVVVGGAWLYYRSGR
jgi:hypothetical protein